ncbi:MAG: hypothetical protein CFE45_18290 [Burkholderiales bacterium PBB5]|nr:MAG: hypothetical protein CFE45_18290 [Burkholderiales bacterium PBB5]
MFVLPALVLPVILVMALARLWSIPRQLRSGAMRLRAQPVWWRPLTVLAYGVLLVYTVGLCLALARVAWLTGGQLQAWLPLVGPVAAYPLVYLATAWVFFHGLRPGAELASPADTHGAGQKSG